jgi:drug/metabolite transporter (DMT)-like permease
MAIFARTAYDAGAEPLGVLAPRFVIAAAVLWVAVRVGGRVLPRGRRLGGLFAAGAVGYTLQAITFFTALEHASAGLVALLLYLYPAIVTVLAALLLGERLTRTRVTGVGLALAGTVLTIGPVGGGSGLGIALGIAAACIYSVYILVNARLTAGVDPMAAAAVVCTGAACSCTLLALLVEPDLATTAGGWSAVVAIAVVSTVVAIVTFFAGMARVGPGDAATLSTFEPVVTVVLAALVLDERVTALQAAGGAVILGAVILLSRAPAAAPEPERT